MTRAAPPGSAAIAVPSSGSMAYRRAVIVDNAKCAIAMACTHDPLVQRAHGECAEGYGFRIDGCPPHDPQKKGIVESGVNYLKGSFLPTRTSRDLANLNAQAQAWVMCEVCTRQHGTKRQQPLALLALEQPRPRRSTPSGLKRRTPTRQVPEASNYAIGAAIFRLRSNLWGLPSVTQPIGRIARDRLCAHRVRFTTTRQPPAGAATYRNRHQGPPRPPSLKLPIWIK